MDGMHIVIFLGLVSYSHAKISGTELEVTVQPGDNITLYCDCKTSSGVYVVWSRNCSHENQPSLVLKFFFGSKATQSEARYNPRILPRFQFVKNTSSNSFDLLIMNVTESDEGLYYCGTERSKVEDGTHLTRRYECTYSNVTTRVTLNSEPRCSNQHHSPVGPDCWILLLSLCPACAVLSFLLSCLVVRCLCRTKAEQSEVDQRQPEYRRQARSNQDEDLCYAALEIRQPSRRPKKKKTESSDFSTYSAIRTSQM